MSNKGRRAIAIAGLCCMAVFSVSLCLVLADRTLLGGAFGWIALCSGLLGVAAFLVVKFVTKDTDTPFDAKKGPPPYLPVPDEGEADKQDEAGSDGNEPQDEAGADGESEPQDEAGADGNEPQDEAVEKREPDERPEA